MPTPVAAQAGQFAAPLGAELAQVEDQRRGDARRAGDVEELPLADRALDGDQAVAALGLGAILGKRAELAFPERLHAQIPASGLAAPLAVEGRVSLEVDRGETEEPEEHLEVGPRVGLLLDEKPGAEEVRRGSGVFVREHRGVKGTQAPAVSDGVAQPDEVELHAFGRLHERGEKPVGEQVGFGLLGEGTPGLGGVEIVLRGDEVEARERLAGSGESLGGWKLLFALGDLFFELAGTLRALLADFLADLLDALEGGLERIQGGRGAQGFERRDDGLALGLWEQLVRDGVAELDFAGPAGLVEASPRAFLRLMHPTARFGGVDRVDEPLVGEAEDAFGGE